MLNKLSRKDIELLNILAKTPEGKSALNEYIEQHEKAVKAYKVYRESVVAEVEVDKVVKPVGTKRKFKVGDKVRVLCTGSLSAATLLREGDIATVTGYKEYDDFTLDAMVGEPIRPVIVRSMDSGGLLSTYPTGFFEESALELAEEKTPNELRAEIIQRAKEFVLFNSPPNEIILSINGFIVLIDVKFVVNQCKGVVVALLKGVNSGGVKAKGIAKCNPDDVFNEHIGKAIALGRALGKDVSEFENAVQPTVAIGQEIEVLDYWTKQRMGEFLMVDGFHKCGSPTHDNGTYTSDYKITDDTNAQYGGVE